MIRFNHRLFYFILLSCVLFLSCNSSEYVEKKVESLHSRMTLEEKIDYVGGYQGFFIRPVERLSLPAIKMSDGPVGVRNYGKTTAYPASICLAAAWDRDLAEAVGKTMGRDARSRGVHIVLGPGLNIYRAPMCGRNFEYYGEDPYLAAEMCVPFVRGMQGQGVVATVKHFTANNQEFDRHRVSSDMDERALREIYLPAFKAAVQEGRVGAVMSAYNPLNGVHCSENGYLLTHILKEEWGFDGIVISDWGSTYDAVAAANAGLDLEMPDAKFMNRDSLLRAIEAGSVDVPTIDDKVRRILRMIVRHGFMDRDQTDPRIPKDDPVSRRTALDVARGGIVLLKNEDLLPLNSESLRSIAVIGPNSHPAITGGGGSSYTEPNRSISVLNGIRDLVEPDTEIFHAKGIDYHPDAEIYAASVYYTGEESARGLTGEYFNGKDLTGAPLAVRTDESIAFYWDEPPFKALHPNAYSVRWTGYISPEQDGCHTFFVNGDDGYRFLLDGRILIDNWHDEGANARSADVVLEAGGSYEVELHFYQEGGGSGDIRFGWAAKEESSIKDAVDAASRAEVAIVCVGFHNESEGEGHDRSFGLPEGQDALIHAVSSVNPNTIVILNAGGNVDMAPWIDDVKGVIHAWYPGQEGGTAVAEILLGEVNPSGRLPVTFEKAWEDNAVYRSYHDKDGDGRVAYSEGVFLGYRHFDTNDIEPRFPFGFGLSYTTFAYDNLRLIQEDGIVRVQFEVTNTGSRPGADVAQIYVGDPECSVPRPLKELKELAKVYLEPGESERINVDLDASAFSFYDDQQKDWIIEPGEFRILVGRSSREILLQGFVSI